ncbi:MAG: alpha-amylase family glycosyl hydrolase, partial [Mucilaginibacter sp.]
SDQEENALAANGMMTWQNNAFNAEQATMSYNDAGGSWDLTSMFYNAHNFTNPYALVNYFESHDEERLQFKNGAYGNSSGSYSVKDLATGLKRDEMAAAFLFSTPGPKLFWQFGERGYDVSINNPSRLGDKPPHWEYMADPNRHHLYATYAKLIKWKIKNPVFTSTTFTYSLTDAVKFIQLLGSDGTNVEVLGNFGVVSNTASINFPATGTWTDNIDGSTINVTALPYSITLAPGEYHVYSNNILH